MERFRAVPGCVLRACVAAVGRHVSGSVAMLTAERNALILAPMDGITDAPMRAMQGESGAFTFAVSEFLRISGSVPPRRLFHRHVPELLSGARTPTGLPVQVQLLGGDAGRMACAAYVAYEAGARAIDINFGCPAPTVNRHDGGATLLQHPKRIREIVSAVRAAVPTAIPVSAKLRLGWDSADAIFGNADMAAEGGACWLTIHGRTRTQGYAPPALWGPIGRVRERLRIPVVANGDLWTVGDLRRCREETGCRHFMIGRGALADPGLPRQLAWELGLMPSEPNTMRMPVDWRAELERLVVYTRLFEQNVPGRTVFRLKQWLKIASLYGSFEGFETVKLAQSVDELFERLAIVERNSKEGRRPGDSPGGRMSRSPDAAPRVAQVDFCTT